MNTLSHTKIMNQRSNLTKYQDKNKIFVDTHYIGEELTLNHEKRTFFFKKKIYSSEGKFISRGSLGIPYFFPLLYKFLYNLIDSILIFIAHWSTIWYITFLYERGYIDILQYKKSLIKAGREGYELQTSILNMIKLEIIYYYQLNIFRIRIFILSFFIFFYIWMSLNSRELNFIKGLKEIVFIQNYFNTGYIFQDYLDWFFKQIVIMKQNISLYFNYCSKYANYLIYFISLDFYEYNVFHYISSFFIYCKEFFFYYLLIIIIFFKSKLIIFINYIIYSINIINFVKWINLLLTVSFTALLLILKIFYETPINILKINYFELDLIQNTLNILLFIKDFFILKWSEFDNYFYKQPNVVYKLMRSFSFYFIYITLSFGKFFFYDIIYLYIIIPYFIILPHIIFNLSLWIFFNMGVYILNFINFENIFISSINVGQKSFWGWTIGWHYFTANPYNISSNHIIKDFIITNYNYSNMTGRDNFDGYYLWDRFFNLWKYANLKKWILESFFYNYNLGQILYFNLPLVTFSNNFNLGNFFQNFFFFFSNIFLFIYIYYIYIKKYNIIVINKNIKDIIIPNTINKKNLIIFKIKKFFNKIFLFNYLTNNYFKYQEWEKTHLSIKDYIKELTDRTFSMRKDPIIQFFTLLWRTKGFRPFYIDKKELKEHKNLGLKIRHEEDRVNMSGDDSSLWKDRPEEITNAFQTMNSISAHYYLKGREERYGDDITYKDTNDKAILDVILDQGAKNTRRLISYESDAEEDIIDEKLRYIDDYRRKNLKEYEQSLRESGGVLLKELKYKKDFRFDYDYLQEKKKKKYDPIKDEILRADLNIEKGIKNKEQNRKVYEENKKIYRIYWEKYFYLFCIYGFIRFWIFFFMDILPYYFFHQRLKVRTHWDYVMTFYYLVSSQRDFFETHKVIRDERVLKNALYKKWKTKKEKTVISKKVRKKNLEELQKRRLIKEKIKNNPFV